MQVNRQKFEKCLRNLSDLDVMTRNCTPGQMQKNYSVWLLQYRQIARDIAGSIVPKQPKKDTVDNENDSLSEDD